MSNARFEYFERISAILYCFEEQSKYNSFLNDLEPSKAAHNSQASLIRNGLAISNFCYFEDFIKSRLGECISDLPQIFQEFTNLPINLQQLITVNAIESIYKRSDNIKRNKGVDEAITFIQEHTKHIGSTFGNTPYTTSSFSIGWAKENINFDDFTNYLKKFNIDNINEVVKKISSELDSPILDPKQQFSQISTSRHKAAHVASFSIPVQDLESNIKNTITFAFVFDYCITYSMEMNTILEKPAFKDLIRTYRSIIQYTHSEYKYFYKSELRSIKNFSDHPTAKLHVLSKLKRKEIFISKSLNSQFIRQWGFNFTTTLPP